MSTEPREPYTPNFKNLQRKERLAMDDTMELPPPVATPQQLDSAFIVGGCMAASVLICVFYVVTWQPPKHAEANTPQPSAEVHHLDR